MKPRGQVVDDLLDRLAVARVARPHMMGNRPTGDHHHADHHLHIPRPSVATVTMFGDRRAVPREVGAGQIVKHQLRLQVKQIAQSVIQRQLDATLVQIQVIERAIPGLQLPQVDLDSDVLFPARNVAPSLAVADIIGFQPAGQRMLASRPCQPIGQQRQHSAGPIIVGIFFGHQFGPAATGVQDVPQAQLLKQMARHQQGSPSAGLQNFPGTGRCQLMARLRGVVFPPQKPIEHRQHGVQDVASPQIGDDLLPDVSIFPDRLDNPHAFMHRAGRTGNFDRADEHTQRLSLSLPH